MTLVEQKWLTLPVHPINSGTRVVKFVELYIFWCLVPRCDDCCNFLLKRYSVRFHSHLFWRVHVLFYNILFVFNYACCCPTQYQYPVIFTSFNCYSNTTGATNGAGNAYPSGKLNFTAGIIRVCVCQFFLVFCLMFFRPLYVFFFFLIQQT